MHKEQYAGGSIVQNGKWRKHYDTGTDHTREHVPFIAYSRRMENIDELGARFPDMSEVYSQRLQDVIRKYADKSVGFPVSPIWQWEFQNRNLTTNPPQHGTSILTIVTL